MKIGLGSNEWQDETIGVIVEWHTEKNTEKKFGCDNWGVIVCERLVKYVKDANDKTKNCLYTIRQAEV